jgi:hypothetical protein
LIGATEKCFANGGAGQRALAVFRSLIHTGHHWTPSCGCGSARVMHRGPLIPRCSATRSSTSRCAVPPELTGYRRRSWGFTLRSFAPARAVLGRFRPAFPTCRWVNFHLDLFLSRDRPSDTFTFSAPSCRQCLEGRVTHTQQRKRPIAEVHFGSWVSTSRAVRFPPSSACLAGRSCLGFCLFQVFGHRSARPCGLE